MFKSRSLSTKISHKSQKNVFGRTFPANFPKLVLIIYGLLKMSQGQQLPDPELINAKSLDFTKPKLFFKNIGRYVATSTYIHVRIPFNFSQILDTKSTIKQHYNVLLDKHEEPFKTIAKTTMDVSLITISTSIEDFHKRQKSICQDGQSVSWAWSSLSQPWLSARSTHSALRSSTMKSQHLSQKQIY